MTCKDCDERVRALRAAEEQLEILIRHGHTGKIAAENATAILSGIRAALAPTSEPQSRTCEGCKYNGQAFEPPCNECLHTSHDGSGEDRWTAPASEPPAVHASVDPPPDVDEDLARYREVMGDPAAEVRAVLREVLDHAEVSIHVEKSHGVPTGVGSLTIRVRDRLPDDLRRRAEEAAK